MRYFRALSLILLMLCAKGYAYQFDRGYAYGYGDNCGCDKCEDCCCPTGFNFEIGVEYLFFFSSINQPYYVIEDNGGVVTGFAGKRFRNEIDWHNGYRIDTVSVCGCGCDHVRARWTHFPPFKDSDHRDIPEAFPVLDHPSGIAGPVLGSENFIRDRYVYYTAELLYGRPVYCCHGLLITLEGGLNYTFLELKEDVSYFSNVVGTLSQVHNFSRIHSIGPELNIGFEYCLPCNFQFLAQFTGALLISKKETSTRQTSFLGSTALPFIFNTADEHYWITNPYIDTRLGIGYDTCWNGPCFGLDIHLEVGYEIIRIQDGVNRIFFVDDFDFGNSFNQYMPFTVSGPYFRLALSF